MRSSIYRKLALGGVLFLLLFGVNTYAVACVGDFTAPKVQTSEPEAKCLNKVNILTQIKDEGQEPDRKLSLRKEKAMAFAMLTNAPFIPNEVWILINDSMEMVLIFLMDDKGCAVKSARIELDQARLILEAIGITLPKQKGA